MAAGENAVRRIYGCFVNERGELITDLDEPLSMLPQEEAEQYFALLKKSLSGRLGKHLIDLVFSTQQVVDSEEHKLLMALRESAYRTGSPPGLLPEGHGDLGPGGQLPAAAGPRHL